MKNILLTAKNYIRRISYNERVYLALEKIKPGFCIQIIFEGKSVPTIIQNKNEPDFEKRLHAAVVKVAECNPGVRLVARGKLGWARWLPIGPLPRVRKVEVYQDGNALPSDLDIPLCPYQGPSCEIVYSLSQKPRLVFRCFHGVMDAGGLLHFAEEIFRALRNEPLLGTNSALNDTEFVTAKVGKVKRNHVDAVYPPIGNCNLNRVRTMHHLKMTVSGSTVGTVAKVAAAITMLANRTTSIKTRIMIPVDVRNYDKAILSTANLSYPLFLETSPQQSWEKLHKLILKKLIDKEALKLEPIENVALWLPLWLLKGVLAAWIRKQRKKKRFFVTALVAHVVLKDADLFNFNGYEFHSFYFLPQQSDFIPLCVAMASTAHNTEVLISAPNDLMDEDNVSEISKAINTILTSTEESLHSRDFCTKAVKEL